MSCSPAKHNEKDLREYWLEIGKLEASARDRFASDKHIGKIKKNKKKKKRTEFISIEANSLLLFQKI